jgi:hypothetical protein
VVSDQRSTNPLTTDHRQLATVLDVLASLMDKSLLRQDDPPGTSTEPRFMMLETIREFGLEQLAASGELEAARRDHLAYFLALAVQAETGLKGREQFAWLARLDAELDNLRAALGWALEHGEAVAGLRLAGSLHWHWFLRSYWVESIRLLKQILAMPAAAERSRERAKTLMGAGVLVFPVSDYVTARAYLDESIAISRELGDASGIAYGQLFLAWPALVSGEYAAMSSMAAESVAIFREVGDEWGLAMAHSASRTVCSGPHPPHTSGCSRRAWPGSVTWVTPGVSRGC